VKLLLDTHVLVWWLEDNPRLISPVRSIIADRKHRVMVSVASFWELSIKFRKGRIDRNGSGAWHDAVAEGFEVLNVVPEHYEALEVLPNVDGHGDPFDHLILAQTVCEQATLITADRQMADYGIACLGAS